MKRFLVILIAVFASISLFSQDIIILKSGDEIKSKVIEITVDLVKYKKWENPDGPMYNSNKTEVFMIKYENGTKDVFKTQENFKQNTVPINNEDIKKNEAVKNLENYVKSKFKGQVVRCDGVRKTNGTMVNAYGQMIYTINFDIDIKFINNGWLKGNDLEGYWSNDFYVYPSQPDLSASGLQYMYVTKLYPSGTSVTLGCVATMNSTDNGFMVKSLSVKTETNYGITATSNQSGNNSQNEDPAFEIRESLHTSHISHFKQKKTDIYLYYTSFVKKGSPSIDKNLFYHGDRISLQRAEFGTKDHYKNDELIVKKGDTLSLDMTIGKFKKTGKEWDGKTTDYLLSIQIEDNAGKEYLSETYEKVLDLSANTSTINIFAYNIEVPIKIAPTKLLLLPSGQDLYLSFLVIGKTETKSRWDGFVKFRIE